MYDIRKRLKQLEDSIPTDVILITLEDGSTERWLDIDLTLSVFNYPEMDIRIFDDMVEKTALSMDNLPIKYKYEKAHENLAQYQMWLIQWLDLMCDTAVKRRRKGK